ncbi:MAG: hypothetical protein AB3N23_05605 [Paracoccaceae bacterium]
MSFIIASLVDPDFAELGRIPRAGASRFSYATNMGLLTDADTMLATGVGEKDGIT